VTTKADLPDPETLDAGINYLCRVIADPTQANNGVWQRIAGTTEWTYFSDNLDFVDETELADAIAGEVSDRDGAIEEAIAAEVTARNGAIANAVAPLQSLDATGEAEAETMSVDNPDATVWYPEGEA
jgi:hypothetical protein